MWVPDQLRSAVTRPCRYEPDVNRTYEDLAAHYGAVVVPARPRKPPRRPWRTGAHRPALDTRASARPDLLRSRSAERRVRVLLDELNDRPMKKLGVSRRALRATRPPGAAAPARLALRPARTGSSVNMDYHVAVEQHAYSVPYQLVREQVEVRYTTSTVGSSIATSASRRTGPLRPPAVDPARAHA